MSDTMEYLLPQICKGFSRLTENQKWFLLGFCERMSMEPDTKPTARPKLSGECPQQEVEIWI